MTPYYEHAGITLYHGDVREVAPQLQPGFDVAICDPPYGETALAWDRWPDGWVRAVGEVLRPNGSLWCFGSMRMFLDRRAEFDGWRFAQDVVWEKNNGSGFDADRFRRVHEHALHWYRGAWGDVFKAPVMVPYTKRRNKGVRPADDGPERRLSLHRGRIGGHVWQKGPGDLVLQTSVVYAANCKAYAENETQKPEAIVRPLLQYSAPPGGLVFSPFAGSGTDLAVAKSMGLRAVGCEVREQQCEVIARRLAQEVLFASS